MRIAQAVELTHKDRSILSLWLRDRRTPPRKALRAKIVLAAAAGKRNEEIAKELGCARRTVGTWRAKFVKLGVPALEREAPRSGRKPTVSDHVTAEILRLLATEKPRGRSRWSTRTMAQAVGVSHSTVSRVWKLHRLEPHRVKTAEPDTLGSERSPRKPMIRSSAGACPLDRARNPTPR